MVDQERFHDEMLTCEYGRALFYNPERQEFIVGTADCTYTFPIADCEDIETLGKTYPNGLEKSDDGYYLVMRGFDLVALSPLRKYVESLNDDEWKNLRLRVGEVIEKVFLQISPGRRMRKFEGGFVGIEVYRLDNGRFGLQTMGNCACLGFDGSEPNHGRSSTDYSKILRLHNTDTSAQRLSLYAGIGALAWFATNGKGKD